MKSVVIYHSQTGFSQKYAQWIAQALNADCFHLKDVQKKNLDIYDSIVFGSYLHAAKISKIQWFTNQMHQWQTKKLVVFGVGASPADNPEILPALRQNFTDSQLKNLRIFYCPGGLKYEAMPLTSKILMRAFVFFLKAKNNSSEEHKEMISMMSSSYDLTDKKYIEPIIEYLKS